MMTENLVFYIVALVVLVGVFLLVKRLASCLIKTVVLLVVAAALAYIYFNYYQVV